MANGHEEVNGQSSGMGFVGGLFTGAVIGAGIGLLFAPRKGAELRQGIADSATSAKKAVTNRYRRTSEAVGEAVDEIAGRGRKAYEQAHKVVSRTGGGIARTADEAMRGVENIASVAKEAAKEVAADVPSRV